MHDPLITDHQESGRLLPAATCLRWRSRPVVTLEFDAQNLMGATSGLDTLAEHGFTYSLPGDPTDAAPWHTRTWRDADGVLFVSYGQVDAARAAACHARLAAAAAGREEAAR